MLRIIKDYALMIGVSAVIFGMLMTGTLVLRQENAPEPVAALASTPVPSDRNDLLVDASWLAAQRNNSNIDPVIIDLSDGQQYALEHIPGAVHIIWQNTMNLTGAGYGEAYSLTADAPHAPDIGATSDQIIVVYDNKDSEHASRFVWQLRASGYSSAVVLDGGLAAWKGAQQPVSQRAATPVTVDTPEEQWDAHAEITTPELAERLHDPNLVIIDTRTSAQQQDTINDTIRIGQIPGSVSLPAFQIMRGDGTFASPDELEAILAPLDLSPENEIVVYGRFGIETGQVWLALRLAGYENVRVYDDGWLAWGFDKNLPIEPVNASPAATPVP